MTSERNRLQRRAQMANRFPFPKYALCGFTGTRSGTDISSPYRQVLAIPTSDTGTYRSQFQAGAGGELVMYDRVPGGAGYVERIVEQLGTVLQAALDRTRRCRNPLCDPEGSCYACLRSYGNQFKWNVLKRGPVARWLERFCLSG